MDPIRVEMQLAGRRLILETGVLAKHASGSVLVRYGDTAILCCATISSPRAGIDFFPLIVDYEEKFYATGKIKGSRFVKREGRPSDTAVLASRLIDRPIRPLFPKDFVNEVQVITTVLSADMEVQPQTTAIIGASAALMLSGAPFGGPLAAVRIGLVEGKLVVNPTYEQVASGGLDLVVSGVKEGIMMVEAGAKEISEELMVEAMALAQKEMEPIFDLQDQLVAVCKPEPIAYTPYKPGSETIKVDDVTFRLTDLKTQVADFITEGMLDEVVFQPTRLTNERANEALTDRVVEKFAGIPEFPEQSIRLVVEQLLKKHVRLRILGEGRRPDGRGPKDVRPIWIQTGLLPRAHGSAVFQRGETQALSVTTLGSKGAAQLLDEMDKDSVEHYFHHYNFPPYSTGEVKPQRSAGRREIGHGHLAERAIKPMLPAIDVFPYTIRVVSEILESNGSTSMAATCGSTLSLMDAGVPLTRPVSGIAMGLMSDAETGAYAILSDIKDIEDFGGDMDFKVAGTSVGITALQMDIKLKGLPIRVLAEALQQAKEGRAHILSKMLEAINAPRTELSKFAPRVVTFKVHPEQIRTIIGPGGKTINEIIDTCKVEIDVEDDGSVFVTSSDAEGMEKAVQWIKDLTSSMEVGEIFEGKVVKIVMDKFGKEIGAIVEKSKGKDGMIHISELAPERVAKVSDVVRVGDTVKVKVLEVDTERGRISLSRKALLPGAGGAPDAHRGSFTNSRPAPSAPVTPPAPAPAPAPEAPRTPNLSLESNDLP